MTNVFREGRMCSVFGMLALLANVKVAVEGTDEIVWPQDSTRISLGFGNKFMMG